MPPLNPPRLRGGKTVSHGSPHCIPQSPPPGGGEVNPPGRTDLLNTSPPPPGGKVRFSPRLRGELEGGLCYLHYFGFNHGIIARSSRPTFSMRCSFSRRRMVLKKGRPARFSKIQERA
jgi:hypothetical protein